MRSGRATKKRWSLLGFHRAGPEHVVGGNQDAEMNRQEVLIEMTAGVGGVFLGMTMNCARCHNHKFDPILQSDYYRLQAVFADTEGKEIDDRARGREGTIRNGKERARGELKPIEDAIKAIEKPYKDKLIEEKKSGSGSEASRAAGCAERQAVAGRERSAKERAGPDQPVVGRSAGAVVARGS